MELVKIIEDAIKKRDNEIISTTISAFENALYEYGHYDDWSQKIEIYREDLQRLMYHISVDLKGE